MDGDINALREASRAARHRAYDAWAEMYETDAKVAEHEGDEKGASFYRTLASCYRSRFSREAMAKKAEAYEAYHKSLEEKWGRSDTP